MREAQHIFVVQACGCVRCARPCARVCLFSELQYLVTVELGTQNERMERNVVS